MTTEAWAIVLLLVLMIGMGVIGFAQGFWRGLRSARINRAIRLNPGVRASKLATMFALSPTLVHKIIRDLEDQSKITTLPAEHRDRRCWTLSDKH